MELTCDHKFNEIITCNNPLWKYPLWEYPCLLVSKYNAREHEAMLFSIEGPTISVGANFNLSLTVVSESYAIFVAASHLDFQGFAYDCKRKIVSIFS